jgi:hypothetical protein
MVSFVAWMKDQEKREGDPVGWFACYWRDLEHPRLSSPASIAKYLEDQRLFENVNGLTEAYDATLSEYRKVRAGIVQDAARADGIQIPLPEHQPGEPVEPGAGQPASLAGQAVARATAAAQEAVQRHQVTITGQAGGTPVDQVEVMLGIIMRKLERIEAAMGLATDEDDGALPAQLPWSDWYEQAAVFATAHGPGWDRLEGA